MSVQIDTENGEVREQRQLRKSGDSTVVSLPPEVLEHADVEQGDEVTVAVGFNSGTIELRVEEEE